MTNKSDKVLVTGGAGYVGSVLISKLVNEDVKIKVFDKFYFGKDSLLPFKNRIEIVEGDIRNLPNNIFNGVSTVIHLAGLSNDPTSNYNPRANEEINTLASINMGKLAKKMGVEKFIFASSCSIYDKGINHNIKISTEKTKVSPIAYYSKSKYEAEKGLLKLADNDFCVTVLRKGTIHGVSPRMRYDLVLNTMVKNVFLQKELIVFCKGVQWRPIIDVSDVADAYIKTALTPSKLINGEIINIVNNNLQIKDLAMIIKRVIAEKAKMTVEIKFEQDDKIDRSYKVSGAKATRLLGFDPKVSIEESVVRIINEINSGRYRDFDNPKYYNIRWMQPFFINEGL